MKTREKKPSRRTGASSSNLPDYHLCQVFPLYDETGFPATCARVDGRLSVGREADFDNRLQIFDYSASREHFRIEAVDQGLVLVDLDSTNGTYLNGTRIRSCPVACQDIIRISDSIFVLTEEPPATDREAEQQGITVGSYGLAQAVARTRKVARDKRCVLLLGETGTGKDVLVQFLHDVSGRSGKLVTVNCATIQENLLETTLFGCVEGAFTGSKESAGLVARAHKGTLFLDELGELPQNLQAKLLRFLETGEVLPVGATVPLKFDVRIAAATNRLNEQKSSGAALRQDLLGRLEDEVIRLPALRHRREEIVPLICRTLQARGVSPQEALDADLVESALLYHWPRNVRQLLKSTESALMHGGSGEPLSFRTFDELLSAQAAEEDTDKPQQRSAPSLNVLREALRDCNGNVTEVARRFKCDRKQVYRWFKRYGLPR